MPRLWRDVDGRPTPSKRRTPEGLANRQEDEQDRPTMAAEQRKHPRLARNIEASWWGTSGGTPCRISDISWGGCFVQARGEPQVGEETSITLNVEGVEISLRGTVRSVERPIGFSIHFTELTTSQIETLKSILGPEGP